MAPHALCLIFCFCTLTMEGMVTNGSQFYLATLSPAKCEHRHEVGYEDYRLQSTREVGSILYHSTTRTTQPKRHTPMDTQGSEDLNPEADVVFYFAARLIYVPINDRLTGNLRRVGPCFLLCGPLKFEHPGRQRELRIRPPLCPRNHVITLDERSLVTGWDREFRVLY